MSTWMLVEDDQDIYEILMLFFETWAVEGITFFNGDDAISWIEDVDKKRYRGDRPELALIDYRLFGSESDGIEVARRLRASPVLKNVPIVMISGFELPSEQIHQLEQSLIDRFIKKPLPKHSELCLLLEEIIAERQGIKQRVAGSNGTDKDSRIRARRRLSRRREKNPNQPH